MNKLIALSLFVGFPALFNACAPKQHEESTMTEGIPVIIDTDANNELDDQHAMAYLFFNQEVFAVKGVTVNATRSGGNIDNQYAEAERVMKLCAVETTIPLFKGADKTFSEIRQNLGDAQFDGHDAVDFIIQQGENFSAAGKLVIVALGKLTNIALALQKEPALADKIRLVWLGSNYPEPGEYNQDNDTVAMNYVLNSRLEFEIVTVRYGKPSGTDAVKLTQQEANQKMPGLGPRIESPVEGRHGGMFNTFGDYSVSLFEHIEYHGDPPSRALYDMAAVAIVKNPHWAENNVIHAPILIGNNWVERPNNPHMIKVWENFSRTSILNDFFNSLGFGLR
ncbi:MAG: nucleoside hydrolase [Cyclobacteriaceae bacterium]|nr:nucleoside hydrolase [Cyclobacteriaceae bacterium]MDH4296168.1 nucleoside hydrolase [Cyclobacteriaceae bacterium]MDH5249927.1 nucleoside hydrolase [Cyclobacteriaceae bacterium]